MLILSEDIAEIEKTPGKATRTCHPHLGHHLGQSSTGSCPVCGGVSLYGADCINQSFMHALNPRKNLEDDE